MFNNFIEFNKNVNKFALTKMSNKIVKQICQLK